MAEVQKPVEVLPLTDAAPIETKPVEETPAPVEAVAPVVEDKPAEEVVPAETTEEAEAPKEEAKKEEVKPVEAGLLGHKAQGLSFPKNLIPSREFFFFGTDAFEPKALSSYQKSEKSVETAHSNIAWASETGKGLLFVGDKKAPSSIISLADATEPEVEGSNKFTLTSKGNKHSFKASSTAERDNWVSQLKLKIAEAKDLSATVTESETYKATIESFKPAPPAKKEEKAAVVAPVVPAEEEAAKTEEAPAATEEAAKEEETKTEAKTEEPKRRSASRKRASFFGFGKKDEKKEEVKTEETPAVEATPAAEVAPVVEAEAPVEETAVTEAAPATEATPVVEESVESPKDKAVTPNASKRNSFFGGVFSKKEKKATETKPAETTEAPVEGEVVPADETAPVIPPVETTTPLAVDVASPATVPTETVEVSPATNGEVKKDTKEKRKSSLPFAFGKREKSPAPAEGEAGKSAFSKLRATIKGKSAPKTEDKPAEEAVKEEAKAEETTAEPATETAAVEEPVAPVEPEVENKPENVASTTPAVTAAA
jgi:hypothetical protein